MLKIAIADDNDIFRAAIVKLLRASGYAVAQCCDGHECLKVVRDWKPKLVITDLLMPGMEGTELIIALRREFPQILIIAVSGVRHSVCLKAARLLGAVRTLSKPFEVDELLAAVAEITAVAEGA